MTNRLYVDIHILQTMPPSCVNRDDTGSPKTAVYGGVTRARVSSQAWKKAVRDMFRGKCGEPLLDESQLGQRTKDIVGLVCEQILKMSSDIREEELPDKVQYVINLASEKPSKPIIPETKLSAIYKGLNDVAKEFKEVGNIDDDREIAEAIINAATTILANDFSENLDEIPTINKAIKRIKDYCKKYEETEKNKLESRLQTRFLESDLIAKAIDATGDALFFMGLHEATRIAALVIASIKNEITLDKKDVLDALNWDKNNQSHAVDIALFGRMVAKAPALNVDASAQVAHAISTHKVQNEFDFFTGLDDRKKEPGAAMIGTVEYNSSTLYRYATIAVHELRGQLGGAELAAKAVRAFADAFARSVPTGKINTFANRTLPDAVYVAIRKDQPLNLVGAFERPVKASDKGYVAESAKALVQKANEAKDWIAQPLASLAKSELLRDIEGVAIKKTLDDLLSCLEEEVRSGLQ